MRYTNDDIKQLEAVNKLLKAKINALIEFYTATYTEDIQRAKNELQRINDRLGGTEL